MFIFRIFIFSSKELHLLMRYLHTILSICLVSITFFGCGEHKSITNDTKENELLGTWELEKVEFMFQDTTIIWDNTMFHSLYFIEKTHFNFIYSNVEKDELLFAGHGSYTLSGSKYIEHINFHSIPYIIGTSVVFESTVEGDTWIHEGRIPTREEDILFFNLSNGATNIHMRETRRRVK